MIIDQKGGRKNTTSRKNRMKITSNDHRISLYDDEKKSHNEFCSEESVAEVSDIKVEELGLVDDLINCDEVREKCWNNRCYNLELQEIKEDPVEQNSGKLISSDFAANGQSIVNVVHEEIVQQSEKKTQEKAH